MTVTDDDSVTTLDDPHFVVDFTKAVSWWFCVPCQVVNETIGDAPEVCACCGMMHPDDYWALREETER